MITTNSVPVVKSNVRSRKEHFGKLIIAAGLPMLSINDDACAIWDLCDGNNNVQQITKILHGESKDVPEEDIQAKVFSFLNELLRLKLIDVKND